MRDADEQRRSDDANRRAKLLQRAEALGWRLSRNGNEFQLHPVNPEQGDEVYTSEDLDEVEAFLTKQEQR